MRTAAILSITLSLASTAGLAQTVRAPAATNSLAGHASLTGANAVQVVPKAHEVPAAGVGSASPSARPFASGVTAAGNKVSTGIRTGSNVASKNGVSASPAAGTQAVPVATPIMSGSAAGAGAVVTGAGTTASAVAQHGPQLNPTGPVSAKARDYQTRAVGDSVNQAKRTATSGANLQCQQEEYQRGEC